MSDETPAPETPAPEPAAATPETPAAEAVAAAPATPTAPAPTAAATAPAAAPATPAAAPAPVKASHVAVPKWVLTTVAAVVGAGVMFGIGYAVGDGSSSDGNPPAAVGAPFGNGNPQNPFGNGNPQMPGFPGPGNQGNGNQGNGNQQAPRSPNQSASGAFLGVATQQTNRGLEIIQVVSGSAADDAGLHVGDVIVEFDGNDVTTPAQLANAVSNLDPGDEVEITYERDGNTRTTTVELGSRSTTNSN